ncbi:hypothetical protein K227x_42930 [Rubripirellula lacrimiformis]|uniref:Uncharacterized protein n=1 Tax=Rubripirellula lacrimiformis TaxID=1930273 RepID=A0A517NFP2_9BACT|nr:hypothetical protein [Rubripirellula lacrimiformis]QDT05888.1 hypothetical protein K227x_42930 [Rubripirellula lacrimiformis]
MIKLHEQLVRPGINTLGGNMFRHSHDAVCVRDDNTAENRKVIERVKAFPMTASERVNGLVEAVRSVVRTGFESVTRNSLSTGYPRSLLSIIQGKVEDTIPTALPSQIARPRLVAGWYESINREMTCLYHSPGNNSVLAINDDAHRGDARKWIDGCRTSNRILLGWNRIDDLGRFVFQKAAA